MKKQLKHRYRWLGRRFLYFARIIHLADVIDAIANNIKFRQEKWDKCCEFLVKQKELLFDDECVEAFFEMISKRNICFVRGWIF